MIASRARVGTLSLLIAFLIACGGPSLPDLPSPASGISALTDMFSSQFGIPSGAASQAVGGMLGVANNVLPSDTWNAVASSIPGAEELLGLTMDDLPAGASLESLDDIGSMLGSGSGVGTSQLAEMGSMMEDYLASAVDDEGMRSQIESIFP